MPASQNTSAMVAAQRAAMAGASRREATSSAYSRPTR